MSKLKTEERPRELVQEYELDAPPEKVWRAVSDPAFRKKWLPGRDLADAEPVSVETGEEIRYRMRDDEPPYLESIVAFQLRPDERGGTILTIVHGLADARLLPPASNNNESVMMRAA
ncbi:SRPBCC domain-containing protein [Parvibaculum sp.]|uniref:SRPBCC family protein n=1 Tax=Parvibaculum sp. TaxID=2024848 RepID=UPI000C8EEF68|nr:SRPBCC domain-containing protein [Parvibaculum sp.]MAB13789.1 polyketide cyclase [Parvibaculum sp.]